MSEGIFITGSNVMVLRHDYDQRQLWLPFIDAVLIPLEKAQTTGKKSRARRNFDRRSKQILVVPSDQTRMIYEYIKGVPQYPLPFEEFRCLKANEYERALNAELPTWDRDENNKIHILRHNKSIKEVEFVLKNICQGRFHVGQNQKIVVFEKSIDHVMAKLAL